ncbi:hypothetical protein BaRGS_00029703 [Batillaria attramentaria]|uniref:Ig-like domain-containing protein n=1 Tax=Batillaria attramentaria TaxID=370345 RepID=A0ABD0JVY6_9CAEN
MALTCKANDVNPEPLYRWIGVICDEGNDGSRCSFTPDPDWHDGRSVTCTAANPSSYADLSSSAHFVMNISYKTEVARFTANDIRDATTVSENMQVVFRCSADGRPAPNLTIQRLDTDSPLSRVSGKQEIIHTDKSISCQEAGTYVCTAENGFPNPDSRTIDVSVKCGSKPGTLDDKTRLKIIIVGGGASGGVVIVVVAIIIICRCGYRRYERPPSRRDEDEENPYTGLNVRATPPELPPRRGNYELPQLTQSTVDENLYDDLAIRDAEQTPKKRRLLCPNKRKKKTNRVDRDSI